VASIYISSSVWGWYYSVVILSECVVQWCMGLGMGMFSIAYVVYWVGLVLIGVQYMPIPITLRSTLRVVASVTMYQLRS
jgi:hypothetical protein